jgi:hypothetical protein
MRKKITYLAGAMTIVLLIAVIKHENEVKGDEQFRYLDSIASKQTLVKLHLYLEILDHIKTII